MKKTTQAASWAVSLGSQDCPECGADAVSTAQLGRLRRVAAFVLQGSRVSMVSVCEVGHQWPAPRQKTHRIKDRRIR